MATRNPYVLFLRFPFAAAGCQAATLWHKSAVAMTVPCPEGAAVLYTSCVGAAGL
jgi:hypothetical protein